MYMVPLVFITCVFRRQHQRGYPLNNYISLKYKNPILCPFSFVCIMSQLSIMNVCIVNGASCGPYD